MNETNAIPWHNGAMVKPKGRVYSGTVEVASALATDGTPAVLVKIGDHLLALDPDQAAALAHSIATCAIHAATFMEDRSGDA